MAVLVRISGISIPKGRDTNREYESENILNILSHQEDVNQNCIEIPSHHNQNKTKNNKCWQGPLRNERLHTTEGNGNWYSHMKIVWKLLKRLKIELLYVSDKSLLGTYSKDHGT